MRSRFILPLTLTLALIFSLLPLPVWMIWYRPAWVLMVLMYWALTRPYQVNVGTAWLCGILLDLLSGTLLGEHAVALTIVIYLVVRMHIRLRIAPMLQQGFS